MDKFTRTLLIEHYQRHPLLQVEDIFKFLFQSSYGCEHLLSSENRALDYIRREYEAMSEQQLLTETLDGSYTRVYLSALSSELSAETLARLFCLSAKKEPDGKKFVYERF